MKPGIPKNENERQAALNSYNILDSLPEESFDDLTLIASQICNTPIALISLIDNERQWFKSKFGLDINQTNRDISFCGHAINEPDKIFEVNDARKDNRFSENPLVTSDLKVRFYAGVPLIDSNNLAIGTLCVLDQKPKALSDYQTKALKAVARQIMSLMHQRRENQTILSENEVKDQIIALEKVKYMHLYDDAPDMMISIDPKTKKVVQCNQVACLSLGYTKKELIDLDVFKLYHQNCLSEVENVLKEFSSKGFVKNKRLILRTKKGKKINVDVNIKSVKNKKGEILYSNSVLRDVDNLISIENELLKLNNNLEIEIAKRTLEIKFNKERLESILDGTRDGFLDWTNVDADATWWSSRLYEILGYTKEEMDQKMSFFMSQVHLDDLDNVSLKINTSIQESSPFDHEFRLKTKQGNYKWVRGRGVSTKNSKSNITRMSGSITDIDDRKDLELELIKTKRFLQKVMNIAPSIIYVFDQQKMSNEYSNREIGKILGYSASEIRSFGDQLMGELCHPEDLNEVFTHFSKIKELEENETVSVEYRMKHKDGRYLYLLSEDTVFERNNLGEVIKHIGIATEITHIKEINKQLSIQTETLEKQNQDLKQFAYVAMHDLKNPMIILAGHFNFLKDQFTKPSLETQESIQFIDEEIHSFMSTVGSLNSAIQIREVNIDKEFIDFNSIVLEVVSNYENSFQKLDGNFILNLADDPIVIGTEVYIKSILTNLITNAIKYRSLSKNPTITINSKIIDNFLIFDIKDNGLGINLKLQKDKIFKMFSRFHNHSEGSGMGLYMVKSMIEKMGGMINIESQINKGTKFSIKLIIKG